MKGFNTVLKILAVLAAIGAAVYVGITYGDKIIAWVKKVLKPDCQEGVCCCDGECADDCRDGECAEGCCQEAAEEASADEGAVEAEDNDFEG